MSLKPCRECGHEISTKASVCPNCGAKNPSATRRGCLIPSLIFVGVIVILAVVGSNSNDGGSNSQDASRNSSTPDAFVGDKAIITGASIGCTDRKTVKKFYDDYSKAEVAHDKTGEQNALNKALFSDCTFLTKGETGLVIDESGFLVSFTRIRLDKNKVAYWTSTEAVAGLPSSTGNGN